MTVKRWGKQTKSMENLISDRELDFVLMEFETENLNAEVYRYYTQWKISVVYYMFNFQLLEEDIFEPVYLFAEDVYSLQMTENAIFERVLHNTVNIFQTRLIPFQVYLKEMEMECEREFRPIFQGLVEVMGRIKRENWLWCVTNNFRERGASGALYKPLLRTFCEANACDRLLIGFSNNDYAIVSKINSHTIPAIRELTYHSNNVRMNSGKIRNSLILLYDYKENSLKKFEENDSI